MHNGREGEEEEEKEEAVDSSHFSPIFIIRKLRKNCYGSSNNTYSH